MSPYLALDILKILYFLILFDKSMVFSGAASSHVYIKDTKESLISSFMVCVQGSCIYKMF